MKLPVLAIGLIILLEIPYLYNTRSCPLNLFDQKQVQVDSGGSSARTASDSTMTSNGVVSKHIVVAHCKEDFAWLDQLQR